MNEVLRAIKNRRAIRNYNEEQIPDYLLQEILSSALYAPNAMNKQNWHFTVIQNKGILNQLANRIVENVICFNNKALINLVTAPGYHPFYKAPTLILISGNPVSEFIQIEAGTAAQNITLAAESLDLGSCIMTMPNFAFICERADELKDHLGIPKEYNLICSVALGYKAGQAPKAPPRKTEVINFIK